MTLPPVPPVGEAVAWSRPGWSAVATVLRERAGLVFSATRRGTAESGMERAMAQAGHDDPQAYAAALASGSANLDDLLAELTVGETYFFREPAQFDFLRRTIVPAFKRRGGSTMRVWSAACSSGEEPYSLAIALAEEGMTAAVLGTDVSRERLAAAKRGRYRAWSFRGVPEATIQRYFRRTQSRTGDSYTLSPEIRGEVEFRYLNLADDAYPNVASGVWGMDLILCRNVMIYFDAATIAHVARHLLDTLAPDGWLLLGASDPPLHEIVACEVVRTGAGLAYRRADVEGRTWTGGRDAAEYGADVVERTWTDGRDGAEQAEEPAPPRPLDHVRPSTSESYSAASRPPDHVRPITSEPYSAPPRPPVHVRPSTSAASSEESSAAVVAEVRSLANRGALEEAARVCVAALETHREVAELHYLHAMLLTQAGTMAAAATAARRALYLDRGMIVAHLALGTALARDGRDADAERAFGTAARLLDALADDAEVPASDGERAGRLRAMVRAQRALLGRTTE